MSLDFFTALKGFKADDGTGNGSEWLSGSGIPASSACDEADLGSYYSDYANGNVYYKYLAGAGSNKWQKIASEKFVTDTVSNFVQGISWREPVVVRSTSTILLTGTPGNTIIIDTITVDNNDRVLFSDLSSGNKNIYIYNKTTGIFEEDTLNSLTYGDTVLVLGGTYAGNVYNYAKTNQWILINQATADELGYIRNFIGKTAAGSINPVYSSTTVITQSSNLVTAISTLDAELGEETITNTITTATATVSANIDSISTYLEKNQKETTTTGITTSLVTVDSVQALSAKWLLEVADQTTSGNRQFYEVHASHDGTNVKEQIFSKINHGSILFIPVISLTLTGGNTIVLRVSVNAGFTATVRAKRLGILE